MGLWGKDMCLEFGDNFCVQIIRRYTFFPYHQSLCALVKKIRFLLARQISRLETRIKECIRVESMMVGKPKMRNESKWDGRGDCKAPWHILPVRIFLKDLSEINSDTTRKMMIYT